jgi:hypothetical protein
LEGERRSGRHVLRRVSFGALSRHGRRDSHRDAHGQRIQSSAALAEAWDKVEQLRCACC